MHRYAHGRDGAVVGRVRGIRIPGFDRGRRDRVRGDREPLFRDVGGRDACRTGRGGYRNGRGGERLRDDAAGIVLPGVEGAPLRRVGRDADLVRGANPGGIHRASEAAHEGGDAGDDRGEALGAQDDRGDEAHEQELLEGQTEHADPSPGVGAVRRASARSWRPAMRSAEADSAAIGTATRNIDSTSADGVAIALNSTIATSA